MSYQHNYIRTADSAPTEDSLQTQNDKANDLPYHVVTQAFSAIERIALKDKIFLHSQIKET